MSNDTPNQTADLVSRLRDMHSGQAVDVACALDQLCIEAAAEIERLRTEVVRLEEDLVFARRASGRALRGGGTFV